MLIVNKENVCGETYLYGNFFQQICYSIYILFNKRTRKKRNIYDPQLTGNYTIYSRTRRMHHNQLFHGYVKMKSSTQPKKIETRRP